MHPLRQIKALLLRPAAPPRQRARTCALAPTSHRRAVRQEVNVDLLRNPCISSPIMFNDQAPGIAAPVIALMIKLRRHGESTRTWSQPVRRKLEPLQPRCNVRVRLHGPGPILVTGLPSCSKVPKRADQCRRALGFSRIDRLPIVGKLLNGSKVAGTIHERAPLSGVRSGFGKPLSRFN